MPPFVVGGSPQPQSPPYQEKTDQQPQLPIAMDQLLGKADWCLVLSLAVYLLLVFEKTKQNKNLAIKANQSYQLHHGIYHIYVQYAHLTIPHTTDIPWLLILQNISLFLLFFWMLIHVLHC